MAVDVAILAVQPDTESQRAGLRVLVQKRTRSPRGWVLPGRFVRERETVEQTIAALFEEKAGITPTHFEPRLLTVVDDPTRDARAWTISIVKSVGLPWDEAVQAHGEWLAVDDSGAVARPLLFDHDEILRLAVHDLRDRYETSPDPAHLLLESFTMQALHQLHEGVLNAELRWDTFKRRMEPQLVLTSPPPDAPRSVGRPPKYYSRRPDRTTSSDARWRLPGEGGGVPRPGSSTQ
ncbi:hypothetical protein ASD30_19560 [Nocardioides sp. Root140]|nr:hypothetical protein ASD30_19560 [Nocardioides sp. Root140]